MMAENHSSSSPAKLQVQKNKAKDLEEQAEKDLRFVLDSPEGRRFIRGLLADCFEHRSVFDTNAIKMAHNEGIRNVGLKLKARIGLVAPQYWQELLTKAD